MTKRQCDVYNALVAYMDQYNYAPSMRELAELVNTKSVSTVYGFLEKLRRDGHVTWEESKSRTFRIIKEAS